MLVGKDWKDFQSCSYLKAYQDELITVVSGEGLHTIRLTIILCIDVTLKGHKGHKGCENPHNTFADMLLLDHCSVL
jgi:hypothetical protein